MIKETAKKLVSWISKTKDEDFLIYVDYRLEGLHLKLEQTSDINEIYRIQGQIKEVKRLLKLKEEVKYALERD